MNLLFLCHRIPYPPNKGEKIRAYHMLAHLAREHRIHLGAFVDDPDDLKHVEVLKALCGGDCHFPLIEGRTRLFSMAKALMRNEPLTTAHFAAGAFRPWLDGLFAREQIDRVIVFSSAMVPAILDRTDFDPRHVIFDMVDVDSDKWEQYRASRGPLLGGIYGREARLLLALERQAAARFGATLLVSQFEADTFARLAPESAARIHAMPNGVDGEFFSPARRFQTPFMADEVPVVMTGVMDYRPNVDAAQWFSGSVLPRLVKAIPNIRFYVVGAKPARRVMALAGPRVTVTGRVEDVRPWLAHAACIVAPLRLARGIQNKVLEGLAMQRPVVATTPASRALAVENGRELLIADDPEAFASAVVTAITGPEREAMALRGRRHVELHYDWKSNLALLDSFLSDPRDEPAKWARVAS